MNPPRFSHTPYADPRARPFAIGMVPLTPLGLFEVDAGYGDYLAEKQRLLAEKRDAVFRVEDGTENAQREVLDLVLDGLVTNHGDLVSVDGDTVIAAATGDSFRVSDFAAAPLELASRLVQEDLCLMRKGDEGWRLAAACVCFPTSWSLAEKFSRPMADIHQPVPGFAGRMNAIIERIFDNLLVDQPVERFNWSFYSDDELHHPEPHAEKFEDLDDEALARTLIIRVERQTLTRLAGSGDILFTIRIHRDRLGELTNHGQAAELAAGLKMQLMAMNEDQLAYKGFIRSRDRIAAFLDTLGD